MTQSEYKKYYSRFLAGHEGKLHFAAHSHHFWPDVTRDAQLAYWDDCANLSDHKWEKIFGEVIPKAQAHIARLLNLKDSAQIAFAPNTHELLTRILSLFVDRPSLNILTTSSEFHSWRRQWQRLSELSKVKVSCIATDDLLGHREKFIEHLKSELQKKPDLFFISQVFFDSGIALTDEELLQLSKACDPQTMMVVDGYHGFAAIPTNLSKLEGRIFYLGGGYKYAQAGEGVGFVVVPKGEWRPAYTGWFAEYANLSAPKGLEVGYSQDGMAFMGATQDPSGFYRFNATWDLFQKDGLDINKIHLHIQTLQKAFLKQLPKDFSSKGQLAPLFTPDLAWHGHFLTFSAPTIDEAMRLEKDLKNASVLIDRRGTRLRFGFGLYQDLNDVVKLHKCLGELP